MQSGRGIDSDGAFPFGAELQCELANLSQYYHESIRMVHYV